MLNRSALIVRPKKPFCDWVRAVDYDDAPEVTLDQMGATLYLVPDYEDPEDAEKILAQITQSNQLSTDGAYYVAKILADRGEKDRARKILEEVLASEALFATRPDAVDLLDALKKDK